MNYYLYIFICCITHPFRWLMPFWKASNFSFSLWVLYRNPYKVAFCYNMSANETANFTSTLYKKNRNCYGMGAIKNSNYQSSSTANGVSGEPAYSAKYTSVYQSNYDFYNYLYVRNKTAGKFFDAVPEASFNTQNLNLFASSVIGALKGGGYFTATLLGYISAFKSHSKNYASDLWRVFLCFFYSMAVVPLGITIFRCNRLFGLR